MAEEAKDQEKLNTEAASPAPAEIDVGVEVNEADEQQAPGAAQVEPPLDREQAEPFELPGDIHAPWGARVIFRVQQLSLLDAEGDRRNAITHRDQATRATVDLAPHMAAFHRFVIAARQLYHDERFAELTLEFGQLTYANALRDMINRRINAYLREIGEPCLIRGLEAFFAVEGVLFRVRRMDADGGYNLNDTMQSRAFEDQDTLARLAELEPRLHVSIGYIYPFDEQTSICVSCPDGFGDEPAWYVHYPGPTRQTPLSLVPNEHAPSDGPPEPEVEPLVDVDVVRRWKDDLDGGQG